MKEFRATIKDGCSLGVFVSTPFSVEKEFGKKRVKVKGTIDGLSFKGVICNVIPFGSIIVINNKLLETLEKKVAENVLLKLDVIGKSD